MNKKLMAVAVAGALAMPGLALAQSSVTIGGFFKVGIEQIKYDSANTSATGRNGLNTSEIRVADNSSRIIFGVSEDLGGGLSAIAQLDNRFSPDNGAIAATGNTWVGLKSSSAGSFTIGRHDLHYGQNASDMGAQASALKATSISLMDYVNIAVTPATNGNNGVAATYAIARTTRTPNSIKWQSPNWGGFDMVLAYSTNAGGGYTGSAISTTDSEADLASCVGAVPAGSCRKGYAWNFNPHFTAENWGLGYSYWDSKPDAVLAEEKGQNAFGYFKWSGFKIGLSYNQSQLKGPEIVGAAFTGSMMDYAKRDAWSVPLSWNSGPHTIYAHYSKADKDKVAKDALGNSLGGTDASMVAVAYNYALSKRTSVGITYAQIRNGENAAYNFFTDSGNGTTGLSSTNAGARAGEDPKLLALIMYHAF
jgi:predicted porin